MKLIWPRFSLLAMTLLAVLSNAAEPQNTQPEARREVPPELDRWLQPQDWRRDTDGPVLSLGAAGDFDDTHIFAPCVVKLDDGYRLWYSGSTGAVEERVFHLGLAKSDDGRNFQRASTLPVFRFGDDKHSVLTSTLLRNSDGTPQREDDKLRLWFSSTDFVNGSGRHALYETSSRDGLSWSEPSDPLLEDVYAPTIIKEQDADGADLYRLWYADVSGDVWVFRTATSRDGRAWDVHPQAVLAPAAAWEQANLFYPTVLKVDGVYLMWYGSYWSARANTTAIGFAASTDGIHWHRNPHSPVLTPTPDRAWESHYTTSQSVIRNADGSFRMWYASRKQPPFVNKYFAINTATWSGPK